MCVIVKDNTLGGTISNSWGCLYGSFLACFVCYIFQSLIGEEYSPAAAIPILLFSTFIFNYIEFHMMGKKLGLSILALNLLTNSPAPALINWILFYNVLMGIFTAWIGNLLPFPRLACDEFVKRTEFCAEAIGDIIIDLVVSWRYACVPYSQIKSQIRKSRTHSSLMGSISVDPRDTSSTPSSSSTQLSPLQPSPHAAKQNARVWRLLRNVILACLAFRSKKTDACWTANHIHHKNNVFMRLEMVNFIEDIIAYLQTLKMDARFGPSRWIALERYDLFLLLLKDFIIVVNIFERRLRDLRHNSEHHDVVLAFQNRPTFRAAVLQYADSLALAIKQAALWLHDPRHTVTTSCNTGMMQLKAARDVLDKEYIDARVEIYYNEDPEKSKQMSSFVAMNQNSFMFLLDASFLLLDQYWSVFRDATSASSTNSWLSHLRRMAESIFKDLFPPQKHLFTLTSDHKLTQVMKMRLYQSLSLAISMCLAGIYGFFASRQQIFMAAFTIAYLTGGAVSGANAVTSMNRATGTVAGSVFAVIIAYIVKGWASHSLRSFFIGVMVVLWQFPCTYVRTMPIYGYAGTVAGFTAPVLLLMPSINEQQAVDRIIDTYVGVLLFVIVDFTIAPAYTDDALLTDIRSVFRGIRHHFSEFIGIFKAQSVSTRGLVRRSSIIKDITHGRDISVYASIFPVPWRPPPLEKRIVDELISGQETAHRSIQVINKALLLRLSDETFFFRA